MQIKDLYCLNSRSFSLFVLLLAYLFSLLRIVLETRRLYNSFVCGVKSVRVNKKVSMDLQTIILH